MLSLLPVVKAVVILVVAVRVGVIVVGYVVGTAI